MFMSISQENPNIIELFLILRYYNIIFLMHLPSFY